jgi:hypothetical protein
MANDRENRFDLDDTFNNAGDMPTVASRGVGDNIDFDDSLPANDREESSIITNDNDGDDEAASDAKDDVI